MSEHTETKKLAKQINLYDDGDGVLYETKIPDSLGEGVKAHFYLGEKGYRVMIETLCAAEDLLGGLENVLQHLYDEADNLQGEELAKAAVARLYQFIGRMKDALPNGADILPGKFLCRSESLQYGFALDAQ